MHPPPLPSDLPIDDKAFVIDQSVSQDWEKVLLPTQQTSSVYTLESIVHTVEKNASIIIGTARYSGTKRKYAGMLPEMTTGRYEELFATITGPRWNTEKIPRETAVSMLGFCKYFRKGTGYVVDEREKADVVVQRMLAYKARMKSYFHLVPKVFFIQRLGHTVALPVALMQEYKEGYCALLERTAAQGMRLEPDEQEYLVNGIYQLTKITRRTHNPNLREDSMLVALAYAIPAHTVTAYTQDHDIKALVLLTRHLAPDRKVDTMLLRKP